MTPCHTEIIKYFLKVSWWIRVRLERGPSFLFSTFITITPNSKRREQNRKQTNIKTKSSKDVCAKKTEKEKKKQKTRWSCFCSWNKESTRHIDNQSGIHRLKCDLVNFDTNNLLFKVGNAISIDRFLAGICDMRKKALNAYFQMTGKLLIFLFYVTVRRITRATFLISFLTWREPLK